MGKCYFGKDSAKGRKSEWPAGEGRCVQGPEHSIAWVGSRPGGVTCVVGHGGLIRIALSLQDDVAKLENR